MKFWSKVEQGIDLMAEYLGRIGWVLVIYCMSLGLFDVIMRYAFNKPSLWIGTTIQYAMVLLACVSGAYALNNDAFVKLDVFYASFSPKVKAICDIATYALTFLYLYVLITKGIDAAQASFFTKQVTTNAVPIPLYHLKAVIPFGAFAVLLVATKKLVQDILTVTGVRKEDTPSGSKLFDSQV
ncbi:TRAP-type mannitol/chloroaromatic compound transport system, small permease component [Desulfonispora thiosulfatigenes DSM 11270]|uniref:TRAP-type mannitol/chloroaromatic compound transport system, small permease component n=1 Tax=Desulfonispora thiosulfatigenes DSM 11270 TaxID=656914 RepID=A0A1W1UVL2_DESTI|nr:TRAP transporter small permease subunit [Desulfonispora thiosulfatigenes]SMB85122.1 TRAP-type mannitol/chloroaromatic compound transport system, small permease component [Desulfonispora thiosulfatigenes DSM 11270]